MFAGSSSTINNGFRFGVHSFTSSWIQVVLFSDFVQLRQCLSEVEIAYICTKCVQSRLLDLAREDAL